MATTARDQITAQFAIVRSLIAQSRGGSPAQRRQAAAHARHALDHLRDLTAAHGLGNGPLAAAERLVNRYVTA